MQLNLRPFIPVVNEFYCSLLIRLSNCSAVYFTRCRFRNAVSNFGIKRDESCKIQCTRYMRIWDKKI